MDTNMTQSKSEANQVVVLGRNQSDLALSRNLFGDEFSEKVLYISGSPVEFKDVLKITFNKFHKILFHLFGWSSHLGRVRIALQRPASSCQR